MRTLKTLKTLPFLFLLMILPALAACAPASPEGRPTQQHTPVWPTTQVPSITPSQTPLPSSTLTPTNTLEPSKTPYDTPTPQPTGTQLPPFNATPLAYKDQKGRAVDYAYLTISEQSQKPSGAIRSLSGFVAFKLLDRGIYRETIQVWEKDLTLYWLRASHVFGGETRPVKLILTGLWGINIPFNEAGADGSATLSFAEMRAGKAFDPEAMHANWNLGLTARAPQYQTLTLTELEQKIQDLPQNSLILAENPVLFPLDSWHQMRLNMTRVSSQAARFHWLFAYNDYDLITHQSDLADFWADQLTKSPPLPEDLDTPLLFGADNLILVLP